MFPTLAPCTRILRRVLRLRRDSAPAALPRAKAVALLQLRATRDPETCARIHTALGEIGSAAQLVSPVILNTIHRTDRLPQASNWNVPQIAREALAKIDPEAAAKLEESQKQ